MIFFSVSLMLECFAYLDVRYLLIPGSYFAVFYLFMWKDFASLKVFAERPSTRQFVHDFALSQVAIMVFAGVVTVMLQNRHLFYLDWADALDHGVVWFVFTVVYLIFMHDAWFYFTHRALHVAPLMRWVHSSHHVSHNPSPWTAYAFHPVESVVVSILSVAQKLWSPSV